MKFELSERDLNELRELLDARESLVRSIEHWFDDLDADTQEEVSEDPENYTGPKQLDQVHRRINHWLDRLDERRAYDDESGFSALGAPLLAFNESEYDPDEYLPAWPPAEDIYLATLDDVGLADLLSEDDALHVVRRLATSPSPPLDSEQRRHVRRLAAQALKLSQRLEELAR